MIDIQIQDKVSSRITQIWAPEWSKVENNLCLRYLAIVNQQKNNLMLLR